MQSHIQNWKIENDFLTKEFSFESFSKAMEFVNEIAPVAEKTDHHPDILVHSYNKVEIFLRTHSSDAITDKDYNMAEHIDDLVAMTVLVGKLR
ncbi:MAG: 4a-hydroxytetrahydrobiopterin dehydratase [Vicingaceae bacterium]